ncbi:hypothetical protein JW865_06265 [Candidatus Bathyarchaeota archaeon]|nr:hypothetical protein [Candidatus Bathyarchaeota archaeon]
MEGFVWKHSSEEEMDETIKKIADYIKKYKLETAAMLVFGTVKPLTPMGGPLSRIFLAPWFHLAGIDTHHIINTLEEPKNIEKLLDILEKNANS